MILETESGVLQQGQHVLGEKEILWKRPGYHGCGSIKGKREKFPKRKEKKRKRRDFLTY